ncbi:MAG TPA: TIGR03557 family F420-dependent LLM class oxidoreductase [Terriglobia bacterium]|nr:TIGR03557 family F420-dependent LLM class oxidoreductase [Terriglobia bacterium]
MVNLGFTLSSEEFGPRDLVRFAARAEEAGFGYALISDHFHPWMDEQGHSPFVWVVVGAIAQATKKMRLGTGVTCPIIRIHPALVAQAAATAADAMPGRFFLGVGTGECLNEHITGKRWPPYSERQDMLKEAVSLIRELWQGELVTRKGTHFTVENARIYTLPEELPPIYVAAAGPDSAAAAAEIGDGLISTSPDKEVIEQFEEAGGNSKPRFGQMTVCWARDEKKARETAMKYWPTGAIPGTVKMELALPSQIESAAKLVREEDIVKDIVCGPDPQAHLKEIKKYTDAGFDHVYIHQVGPQQEECIEFYRKEIFPALGRKAA